MDNFQMNPQHQIPVLKDGDNFTLSESRAIAIYLVEQFGGEGKVHAVWFTWDTVDKSILHQKMILVRIHKK